MVTGFSFPVETAFRLQIIRQRCKRGLYPDRLSCFVLRFATALVFAGLAEAQQYTISTFAGGAPPPLSAVGTDTYIGNATSITTDHAGNIYFISVNRPDAAISSRSMPPEKARPLLRDKTAPSRTSPGLAKPLLPVHVTMGGTAETPRGATWPAVSN